MARIATLLVVPVLLSMGCRSEHHPSHTDDTKFLVTSPLRKDTELTRDYVAQIRAIQHIELRALEKGYLQGIFVDEGRRVPRGARMFQIMPRMYQAEVQKAEAEADLSEIELNNTRLLAEKNVVSPNELALAKAKLNRAKAQVSLATTQKSMTEIRAPFDGMMGRFHVRIGSLVDEGDLLTTLSDNSTVWVYFNVSETEYLHYQARSDGGAAPTPVQLVMADGQLFEQPGKVETIEADFNNETGNLAFRATFPNPSGLLRHGETGKVRMTAPLPRALLVPQKATFDVLDKKFVYVVDDKGVVHSRPITIAAEMPQVYAVESGLDERDRIVVDGLRKVRDGAAIAVEYKSPAEVLEHLEVPAE
ncbi:MAG: efflux RND transporter periplasmic adaptor subunit [Labilithrix sp.]|nr:efflux RND transporter periplasmic adaptor subunit [Labilithrix sp.]MCW5811499.1 efflux RND transporter periplasmic adaptor subunit [Labilithrix sp.]